MHIDRSALRTLSAVLADEADDPKAQLAADDLDVILRLCLLKRDGCQAKSHDFEADVLHIAILSAYEGAGGYLGHREAGFCYHTATLARTVQRAA